jgi:hypothetical protein
MVRVRTSAHARIRSVSETTEGAPQDFRSVRLAEGCLIKYELSDCKGGEGDSTANFPSTRSA